VAGSRKDQVAIAGAGDNFYPQMFILRLAAENCISKMPRRDCRQKAQRPK